MSPRERQVQVSGFPLRVVDGGRRSEQTIVTAHGFPGADHHALRNTPGFENLEASSRVIYYDERGAGGSEHDESYEGLTVARHTEDLEQLLEAMHIERPILVVHDAGTLIGLQLALNHAAVISGLVLVSPRVVIGPDQRRKFEAQVADMLEDPNVAGLAGGSEGDADLAFRDAMDQVFPLGFLHFGLVERTFMKQVTFRRRAYDAWWDAGASLDLRPRLGDLRVPCLVMTGRYEPFVELTEAREIASRIPNARFQLFASSAHWPFLEEPQLFSDSLEAWAAEVAAHIL